MRWIKILFINASLLLAMLGLLFLLPSITHYAGRLISPHSNDSPVADLDVDQYHLLPNYENIAWAKTHFSEYFDIPEIYHDYILWRHGDFAGETITVVDGLRVTSTPAEVPEGSREYWLFGGSTMWA